MAVYYKVVCECGHEGRIKLGEDDKPYSGTWVIYSLENLNGVPFTSNVPISLQKAFEKMKVSCPNCNRELSADNLKFE